MATIYQTGRLTGASQIKVVNFVSIDILSVSEQENLFRSVTLSTFDRNGRVQVLYFIIEKHLESYIFRRSIGTEGTLKLLYNIVHWQWF